WPSGYSTIVERIVTWDGDLETASAPESVTLVLGDNIDISRGDVIAIGTPHVATRIDAHVVWMDERPLDPSRVYLLKQTTSTIMAEVNRPLVLNEIGRVIVKTARPIVFDGYNRHRETGSFILIDPATSFTAGAGMIVHAVEERTSVADHPD